MRNIRSKWILSLSILAIFFYLGCSSKQENTIGKGVDMGQYTAYFFKIVDFNKKSKALDEMLERDVRISDPKYAFPGEEFVGTVEYYGEGNVVLNITDEELKKKLESPIEVLGGGYEGEGERQIHISKWVTFQPGTLRHLAAVAAETRGYRGDIIKNKNEE